MRRKPTDLLLKAQLGKLKLGSTDARNPSTVRAERVRRRLRLLDVQEDVVRLHGSALAVNTERGAGEIPGSCWLLCGWRPY